MYPTPHTAFMAFMERVRVGCIYAEVLVSKTPDEAAAKAAEVITPDQAVGPNFRIACHRMAFPEWGMVTIIAPNRYAREVRIGSGDESVVHWIELDANGLAMGGQDEADTGTAETVGGAGG